MSRVITYKCVKKMQETMTNLPVYDCLKKETYCWFGSAVFAKPCLRYLTSVGLTGATFGSFLANLSITISRKILLYTVENRFLVTYLKCHNESQQI